jgi:hypothetical protein
MKLEVEILQYPTKENGSEAICRAVAESNTGEVFTDIADANPRNVNTKIEKHIIRMASTRAKARALSAGNCGFSIGGTPAMELSELRNQPHLCL